MLKKLLPFLFLLCVCPLLAQVSVLSVTDEDKHSQKEDFWHTFEYFILTESGNGGKCQATRVAKNWFVTAAHCVVNRCEKGCTLQIDLLEQPVSVLIQAKHTDKKPIIFIHPKYNDKERIVVAHDFALLHVDVANAPAVYYSRPTKAQPRNKGISRTAFQNYLKQNPTAQREFNRALRPDLPPLLMFDNVTKRIDRKLSVVSIFDGKRGILQNPNPSDYVKELGFAYTKNFGVREGMSGSGVMTNTGELAGIISSYLSVKTPAQNKNEQYFMFTVFNSELTSFMEEVMGSDYYKIDRKDATPNYVTRSPKNHQEIIEAVQKMNSKK